MFDEFDEMDCDFSPISMDVEEILVDCVFKIDTSEKANWAIQRVKQAQERKDIFDKICESEIQKMKDKMEEASKRLLAETENLSQLLNNYMDTLPCKTTKTQMSFAFPNGKLIRKFAKNQLIKDDETLLPYLKENGVEYIKTTQIPMWGDFKKQLEVVGDVVMRKDTGEVLEVVTMATKPSVFEVK